MHIRFGNGDTMGSYKLRVFSHQKLCIKYSLGLAMS
jgi:hypothetical protein